MKEFAKQFYKSKKWNKCRNTYMAMVGGLCEDCYRMGRITPAEEVHHIKFITPDNIDDPSITLSYDNLVALCRECHKARHNGTEGRRYTVDEMGRVSPR